MPAADRIRVVLRDDEGQPRLGPDVLRRLHDALANAAPPEVVTLEGTDGAFCQGMPLELMAPRLESASGTSLREALDQYGAALAGIGQCPRPVLALVDGPALGGGLGLAAAADVVLATRRAVFGLPEALIGLVPVFAFEAVAARAGVPRARLLAMGGPTLDAESALRIGLVDEIVDDLDVAASRYVQRLARMDPRSVAAVKDLVAKVPSGVPGYAQAARLRALALGDSAETRVRLSRLVAGDAPWLPTSTS